MSKTGIRVGQELAWFDVELADLGNGDRLAIITVRDRYINGPIIRREIATSDHARALRHIANTIDERLTVAEAKP